MTQAVLKVRFKSFSFSSKKDSGFGSFICMIREKLFSGLSDTFHNCLLLVPHDTILKLEP